MKKVFVYIYNSGNMGRVLVLGIPRMGDGKDTLGRRISNIEMCSQLVLPTVLAHRGCELGSFYFRFF